MGGQPHFVLLLGLQDTANTIVINISKRPNFSCLFIILQFLNYVVFTHPNNFFLNRNIHNKKILIAPLDWGLGHATRCQVIIRNLQTLGCDITIAASGKIQNLLQNEFPHLQFLNLPGYEITYSRSKRILPLKILIQVPKILKKIRFENKWLDETIKQHHFNAVISDNRFGLYTKLVPSIFITHQLKIKTNLSWLDKILKRLNYGYINRFTECWVPDFKEELNISGELSHPETLPGVTVKYLGPLSRFNETGIHQTRFKWMVIISGPEPQRSLFEKKIFETEIDKGKGYVYICAPDYNKDHWSKKYWNKFDLIK